ncbi:MAG: hypothetical protein QXP88_00255 [Thermoproteota archaeon]
MDELIDYLNDLQFFTQSQSAQGIPGTLPRPSYAHPKLLLKEYFEIIFKKFNLKNPVFISTAYPNEVFISQSQTIDGKIDTKYNRGISIILKNSSPTKYIGDTISSNKNVKGFLESQNIEVIYWSIDSIDRDYGGDLLKRLLLEGIHSKYFLIKGLSIVQIENSRDEIEDKEIFPGTILYKHIISTNFFRFVFGNEIEKTYKTILSVEVDPKVTIQLPLEIVVNFDNNLQYYYSPNPVIYGNDIPSYFPGISIPPNDLSSVCV